MRSSLWYVAIVLVAALAGPVRADDSPLDDRVFVARALAVSLASLEYARLAERRASHADVKAFARRLRADHLRLNERLLALARELKLAVLAGLDREHRASLARLGKEPADRFDLEFVRQVAREQDRAVHFFATQSKGGGAAVRTFARDSLPILRRHVKTARALVGILKKK
jgi:putative membrane protein